MKRRSSLPRRQVIATARRLGVPRKAWASHINGRKDVAWPIVYSFAQSLARYGVDPRDFWRALH